MGGVKMSSKFAQFLAIAAEHKLHLEKEAPMPCSNNKGEIDKDFYCTGEHYYQEEGCRLFGTKGCKKSCSERHRKYPTPEHFKEEYGEGYPDDGAVYFRAWSHDHWAKWSLYFWGISDILGCERGAQSSYPPRPSEDCQCVCACTPWGKPPDDWRPPSHRVIRE
jgi:hypothetical protein